MAEALDLALVRDREVIGYPEPGHVAGYDLDALTAVLTSMRGHKALGAVGDRWDYPNADHPLQ
jgi:hypothetical protein